MEYKKYACRICSSNHIKEDGKKILCVSCGAIFEAEEETKKFAEEMSALADEIKAERVAALRQQLYAKATAEYIDSEAILPLCRELKTYLPSDFLASFYEVANGGTVREYIDFLNGIDPRESYPFIESVVRFTVKSLSLSQDLILPLYNLIEKTYKNTDTEKYAALQTLAEGEAEKVMNGIYDITVPRDAFIIYSSKDMDKVMELVEVLERQEISCFVALRNLQHGRGAKENYENALKEAMNYCRCVVFVSGKNSRSTSCDALRVELPFLRKEDVRNAPAEYRRGNYTSIPMQYKKRRIEYMIETSTQTTAADRTVKEFFFGLEYCYTPDQVADRILRFDNEYLAEQTAADKEISALRLQLKAMKKEKDQKESETISKLKKELEETNKRAVEAENKAKPAPRDQKGEEISSIKTSETPEDYAKNVSLYLKAAEQGDSKAQFLLGICYENGYGVRKVYAEAIHWYSLSAESGNADAICHLGICYKQGIGVKQDFAKAFSFFKEATDKGHTDAKYRLGVCFSNGEGVEKDLDSAFRCFFEAAEQGHKKAQHNLGICYENGRGVEKNLWEALRWFLKSAEQGCAEAQFHCGRFYEKGFGIEQSYEGAAEWYTLAAEQGDLKAIRALVDLFEKRKFVPQDYNEAIKWLKVLAEEKDEKAIRTLANLYEEGKIVPQDYNEAIKWFGMFSKNEQQNAIFRLVDIYKKRGVVVPKNSNEAIKWLEVLSKENNADAQLMLAALYEEGEIVPQDYKKAMHWYDLAATSYSPWRSGKAKFKLAEFYEYGKGVSIDYNKALDLYKKGKEFDKHSAKEGIKRVKNKRQ